jgi:hypothetical protein
MMHDIMMYINAGYAGNAGVGLICPLKGFKILVEKYKLRFIFALTPTHGY